MLGSHLHVVLTLLHNLKPQAKHKPQMKHQNMEETPNEIQNFTKVWLLATTSALFCHTLSSLRPGLRRLLLLLPVVGLLSALPFSLSSFHLGAPTFFYLVWLANFKILLFTFGLGPLSSQPNEPLPLLRFILLALLPVKVKDLGRDASSGLSPDPDPSKSNLLHGGTRVLMLGQSKRWLIFGAKVVALGCVVKLYDFREKLPNLFILGLYCCHMYLGIEIVLATSSAMVRAALGVELEPQFREPYLATSLRDFWGRRWNLMVSNILHLAVYQPIQRVARPLVGRAAASSIGIVSAFAVSGLMHELIFYYLTRADPTWEVTCFFVLHGVCTVAEVAVKRAVSGSKWRLHPAVSTPLTVGFVMATGAWLFLPQIVRNQVDIRTIDEYPVMINFVKKNVLQMFRLNSIV